MNSYNYEVFVIRSKLLKKVEIICNQFNNRNSYYLENLKDFIDFYLNNNLFNIINNNNLNNLKNCMNRWNLNIIGINDIIINDMSNFIYNYDSTDNEMNDFMKKFNEII